MSTPQIFDQRECGLGESPLWHPLRHTLYWVDIPNQQLLAKGEGVSACWDFEEMISAVGWVDQQRLVLAFETGLYLFQIESGERTLLCPIEADDANTRSNDARTDPWGGFWVGTMSKTAESGKGSIYRWYQGELRLLVAEQTIPNGICFDVDRSHAYFAASDRQQVFKLDVDPENGWPLGAAETFIDLSADGLIPDGAVVDSEGCLWIAMYDAAAVVRYSPDGLEIQRLEAITPRVTCPVFGGADYRDLYLTTAAIGLEKNASDEVPHGATLLFSSAGPGLAEPQLQLG